MSDPHSGHEIGIKTPKQLIAVIVASFVVPIICIVLLVQYVTSANKVGAGSDGQTAEAITARIKPVADIGFSFKDVNAPRVLATGTDVYKATCLACHGAGVAGAPKVGDSAGWAARIAQGYDTLLKHAIEGLRAMPAKGGNPDLDDVEVARAVVYMANESGAKFKEPEVKAPAAAPAGTQPSAAGAAPVSNGAVAPAGAAGAASAGTPAASGTSAGVVPAAVNASTGTTAAAPAAAQPASPAKPATAPDPAK